MSDLVDVINRHVGRPWNPPELDCWAFLALVYSEAYGIVLPRLGFVAGDAHADGIFADVEAGSGRWQVVATPKVGDAIAMGRAGRPHHCGVWIPGDLVAHCCAPQGVAVALVRNLRALGWGGFKFYRHRERRA